MKAFRILAVGVVVLTVTGLGTGFLVMSVVFGQGGDTTAIGGSTSCSSTINAAGGPASLDQEQLGNASTIVRVGLQLGIPERGLVIAIATAFQESGLRNLHYGDRDSVGLFQQRPSSGWGTVTQLTTPSIAAGKFYTALMRVQSWQAMPLTIAAQTVQRSAFPFAYAKWENLSQTVVSRLVPANRARDLTTLTGISCGETVGAGLPSSVVGEMLQVARQQLGRPYVWGATGPGAFDCSGLVVFSWRKTGSPLSVRTSQQMYEHSTRVSSGSEGPGDLLFGDFTAAGPGHVMIVIQRGVAIEAPHTGDVVKIVSYNSDAWTIGRLMPDAFLSGALPN